MKRLSVGIGAIVVITAIPFLCNTPVLANLQLVRGTLVQTIIRPEVQLDLSVNNQVIELDKNGKENVNWEELEEKAVVQPGDILRYTITSENISKAVAKNLVITQPIPQQTTYILGSATLNTGNLTYSIDNGKTFVKKPTIEVALPDGGITTKPAPAEKYTHLRWSFRASLDPTVAIKVAYQVKVR